MGTGNTCFDAEREPSSRLNLSRLLSSFDAADSSLVSSFLTRILQDLNAYLRCVSIPIHEFASRSQAVLTGQDRDPSTVPLLQALTRHYSRVVARVKLQAAAQVLSVHKARKRSSAFASSGAASVRGSSAASIRSLSVNKTGVNFSSPLYRLNHALLVRVFVPSPEGPWLSDASVVACENGESSRFMLLFLFLASSSLSSLFFFHRAKDLRDLFRLEAWGLRVEHSGQRGRKCRFVASLRLHDSLLPFLPLPSYT